MGPVTMCLVSVLCIGWCGTLELSVLQVIIVDVEMRWSLPPTPLWPQPLQGVASYQSQAACWIIPHHVGHHALPLTLKDNYA